MNNRAFIKYYFDINLYNFPISLVFGFSAGIIYGLLIFCSFGIFIGLLAFKYFNENQYYMYYNLGWTKCMLLKKIGLINFISSVLIFLFILIIT